MNDHLEFDGLPIEQVSDLIDECAKNELAYRQAHKNDPCEKCGAAENIAIMPTGSLGRLTALCKPCANRMRWEIDAYWRGFDDGEKHERAKSWWQRLFT